MKRSLLVLLLAGLSAACGRVNPRPAFDDSAGLVLARSGQAVHWARNSQQSAELLQQTRALLQERLSADSAVQVALLNNRGLQANLEEIAIAQADAAQSGLVNNPEFGLSVRFPDRPPSASNLEFGLGQELLDFVLLSPRKKIALAELEQAKLRAGIDALDLIARVKAAYYTLQASQQLAERLSLIVEINDAALQLARQQNQAGTLNELDTASHEAAYQQSRVDLAQARFQARADREELNRLMGLWGQDTAWEIEPGLPPLPQQEVPLQQLESLAMQQRMDIEAAKWGVNIVARALSLKKKTRFFPLGVHVGVDTERDTDRQYVTGPNLSLGLPIFDQGRASVSRLQAQLIQAQRRLEAIALDARSQVRQARDLLIASRDLTEYYGKVLLPQRVRILNLTQQHYNMMLKGTYDLLLAKQNEVEAEKAYVQAWKGYWLARVQLERDLGGRLPEATAPRRPGAQDAEDKGPPFSKDL